MLKKFRKALEDRIVESSVAAIFILLAWAFSILGPPIWEAIAKNVPPHLIFPVLLLSVLLNLILGAFLYSTNKAPEFKLLYGIYWDKERNPHCPSCKKPVYYDSWHMHGDGYYCKPCNKVTPLKDANGKEIKPNEVFGE
ncbi:hypothetical protein [Alcanivorax jadensis]|uniref:hypothetical protein n=1 Tax=Alcanivorax jadensis TaxID=64988 RepID=UPI0026EEDAC5|nr:hypothetical protein [Alcanivorax jadensis]